MTIWWNCWNIEIFGTICLPQQIYDKLIFYKGHKILDKEDEVDIEKQIVENILIVFNSF